MKDSEIIGLYLARNERALEVTASKYGRMLKSIAYNILRNTADSEECENDTYLAAWKKIPPAKPDNFGAFLGRIVRNIAVNRHAYYTADKRNREFEMTLDELGGMLSGGETPESHCETAEIAGYISEYLKSVNRIKRVVFVRRYWYCDSVKEVAEFCGFSESKVKSMLMRTRNELKNYLTEKGVVL